MGRIACMSAAVAAAILLVLATPASATHVQCGDTLTSDTTLDSDLVDCHPIGVQVIGPDITLDLNGHTIDGQRAGYGVWSFRDGFDIKNGTVREFALGVVFDGNLETSGHQVTGTAIADTDIALDASNTNGIVLAGNLITSFRFFGIRLTGDEALVAGNLFEGDGAALITGPFGGNDDNVVTGNHFVGPRTGGGGLNGDRNLVSANVLQGVSGGFAVTGTGNLVTLNTATGTGGVGLSSSVGANEITQNDVTGFGLGIVAGGDGVAVTENNVTEAGTGILVDQGAGAEVSRNLVRATTGDGIFISAATADVLVSRNDASRSRTDDGIDVESPATTITRNRAYRNRDLGIEAVAGVTDGGGNKARGNGNRLQCTGVRCR